jgi:protein-disulfide isomerase/uncharacterized membrane protein
MVRLTEFPASRKNGKIRVLNAGVKVVFSFWTFKNDSWFAITVNYFGTTNMSFADLPFLKRHPLITAHNASKSIQSKTIARWTMFGCSSVAFLTSSYLAWASLTSSAVAGCGGGSIFDCSHVLHSRWASVMSVPVSIPSIAIHLLVLTMLLLNPASESWQRAKWIAVGFAALSAGAAAIWFVGLQVFWIEHLCPYCLVAHTAGLILAGVYLWHRPISNWTLGWVAGASATAICSLIVMQSLSSTPKTHVLIEHPESNQDTGLPSIDDAILFEPPKPQARLDNNRLRARFSQLASNLSVTVNSVSFMSSMIANPVDAFWVEDGPVKSAMILSSLKLETHAWPLLGRKDAELVFVEMFDYTCEHCQRTHKALEGVREKYGDRLSIIALPVPIDGKCNPHVKVTEASHAEACELARLAMAVWLVDKDKFVEMHSFLFTTKPKYDQALSKAKEFVDAGKLTDMLKTSLPGDYISKHVAIYQKAGGGNIPKLMFPKTTSVGAIESADVISQLIEQHLK